MRFHSSPLPLLTPEPSPSSKQPVIAIPCLKVEDFPTTFFSMDIDVNSSHTESNPTQPDHSMPDAESVPISADNIPASDEQSSQAGCPCCDARIPSEDELRYILRPTIDDLIRERVRNAYERDFREEAKSMLEQMVWEAALVNHHNPPGSPEQNQSASTGQSSQNANRGPDQQKTYAQALRSILWPVLWQMACDAVSQSAHHALNITRLKHLVQKEARQTVFDAEAHKADSRTRGVMLRIQISTAQASDWQKTEFWQRKERIQEGGGAWTKVIGVDVNTKRHNLNVWFHTSQELEELVFAVLQCGKKKHPKLPAGWRILWDHFLVKVEPFKRDPKNPPDFEKLKAQLKAKTGVQFHDYLWSEQTLILRITRSRDAFNLFELKGDILLGGIWVHFLYVSFTYVRSRFPI